MSVIRRTVVVRTVLVAVLCAGGALLSPRSLAAQGDSAVTTLRNDSVTVRFVDVDLRAAVQALGRFLDRPVLFAGVTGVRVTLETPRPVPRAEVVKLLRGLVEGQNLELVQDSSFYRVRTRDTGRPGAGEGPVPVAARPGGLSSPAAAVELFVIRLQHARAADVAATVNALYGRASALGELGGGRPATLDEGLRQNQVPPAGAPPLPGAVQGVAGRSATLTGELTIVPDARANSLLIRATRNDFALVDAAVKELDIRPLQVLIEVLIAEVRRDRSFAFGTDVTVPTNKIPGTKATASGGTAGLGLGDFVLKVMGVGGINLDATLRAAAERGDVSIVSRPVVIATNNDQAEILVGSQRPFVQIARALPTDNAARDQVVQYKDVGTRLIVKPTISTDGYVQLEVTQEVNAATTEQQFNAPIISTRTVRTQLLIKDGQTVVLGGLTDRQREANQAGVPLLSSIPLLGGLFGRASRRTTETELFLFITPRVIRTDDDASKVTDPLRRRAEAAKP